MASNNWHNFKHYSLPPNYHIRIATKQDYWKICMYKLLSDKRVTLIMVFFFLPPIFLLIYSILFIGIDSLLILLILIANILFIFFSPLIKYLK